MTRPGFLLFITFALAFYSVVNGYLFWRGWPATSWMRPTARRLLLGLFLFSVLAYPLGRLFGDHLPFSSGDGLVWIGAFYLAFMVYFFIALILIDAFRLGRILVRRLANPRSLRREWPAKPVFLTVLALVGLTVLLGHWNALTPRVRSLEIYIPKKTGLHYPLTLVMASDIHMGRIIRNHRLEEIVALINLQKPDLVLLPGDLTDEDISFLARQNTAAVLRKIIAPLGVYSVTGNHEYYSGKEAAVDFLHRAGVRVLEDEAVELASGVVIVGRKDRTAARFGERRKSLAELLRHTSPERPVLLMDHQPFSLEEAAQNGVDLQLSGHTHNGQLFPGNLIVGRIFETGWGYLKKGPTQVYVSCGVGTWGPPVRTCSLPEVVKITLRFPGNGGS